MYIKLYNTFLHDINNYINYDIININLLNNELIVKVKNLKFDILKRNNTNFLKYDLDNCNKEEFQKIYFKKNLLNTYINYNNLIINQLVNQKDYNYKELFLEVISSSIEYLFIKKYCKLNEYPLEIKNLILSFIFTNYDIISSNTNRIMLSINSNICNINNIYKIINPDDDQNFINCFNIKSMKKIN